MTLPKLSVPALVIVFAFLSVPLKEAFNFPAARVAPAAADAVDAENVRQVEMIVAGVKCKGTAQFFLSRYADLEGVVDVEAYAADHKVIIRYDASRLDAARIRAIGEAPVRARDGSLQRFFTVEKLTER